METLIRTKNYHLEVEQENGLKPYFGPFLALIGPILGPRNNVLAL